MHVFYTPDIENTKELSQDEALHCIKVLRLKENEEILLTDGKGFFYKAIINSLSKKQCFVDIIEKIEQFPLWRNKIEIAIAPTKNIDRTEWFIEKATEIGINKISFLNCRYSERKDVKTQRIEKIMISAIKQSLKAVLPEMRGMIDFSTFINEGFNGEKYIAHCKTGEKVKLSKVYKPGKDVLILIGPEGDFSEEEIEAACDAGYVPVSLGESRLRTETAALVACQTIHIINEKDFL